MSAVVFRWAAPMANLPSPLLPFISHYPLIPQQPCAAISRRTNLVIVKFALSPIWRPILAEHTSLCVSFLALNSWHTTWHGRKTKTTSKQGKQATDGVQAITKGCQKSTLLTSWIARLAKNSSDSLNSAQVHLLSPPQRKQHFLLLGLLPGLPFVPCRTSQHFKSCPTDRNESDAANFFYAVFFSLCTPDNSVQNNSPCSWGVGWKN